MHHVMPDEQTIIAQCTPTGSGAIALLRLSGCAAFEIADRMARLASGNSIREVPSHTIHYGWVVDGSENRIDQVLFLVMRAPKTYTGQDVVEISCHNNTFIIQDIIEQAIAHGARLAQEGEFTKRAVLNNKIDLVQAEAVHELINAQTSAALKTSLQQLEGSLSSWIAQCEKELLRALALSEGSFEFLDEEMEFSPQILKIIKSLQQSLAILKKNFDAQNHIRQGIRIALLGSVNAGKSSLFNLLIGSSRAIVTDIAGTTRDTIEASITRHGNRWTLVDTAGLRHTDDRIEHEGIIRSRQEAHKADIILLIIDAARAMTIEEETLYRELYAAYAQKTLVVLNKTDLAPVVHDAHLPGSAALRVSTQDKDTRDQVEKAIHEISEKLFAASESPFLLTKRQYAILLRLEKELVALEQALTKPVHYELLSVHLIDALTCLSELTGKSISEAGMDMVFREFCVGK